MRIAAREVRRDGTSVEVSAAVDGFRLWYRVPASVRAAESADPFVAAALLPAMLQGEELAVDPALTVSPKLVENLAALQEIHHSWNPVFKIIPIRAATRAAEPLAAGALSFFSGGVDSLYTFLKKRDELTHLVFIQGFDFFTNAGAAGPFAAGDVADLALLAHKLGKPGDGVSRHMRTRLSPDLLAGLADMQAPGRVAEGLEARLADEIEGILKGAPLWDGRRFAGIALRPATRELLAAGAEGGTLYRLNRLLLEDAWPQEIARRDDAAYRTAIDRNARFAAAAGKTLVPVSTNHYAFGYRYNLSRNLTQGSALASVALLLGFPRAYMPSAFSYSHLFPLGQHPLTDPLYANGSVATIHDGAEARRLDKVVRIARDPAVLVNLRVCFNDMNENCGRCAKCLRTMIPLARLGVSGAPFPPLPSLRAIRRTRISDEIERAFFEENLDAAVGSKDKALDRALKACLRRFDRQRLVKSIDQVLLGGVLKRLYLRRASRSAGIRRIDTTPPRG
jgi:hypothetical protein